MSKGLSGGRLRLQGICIPERLRMVTRLVNALQRGDMKICSSPLCTVDVIDREEDAAVGYKMLTNASDEVTKNEGVSKKAI